MELSVPSSTSVVVACCCSCCTSASSCVMPDSTAISSSHDACDAPWLWLDGAAFSCGGPSPRASASAVMRASWSARSDFSRASAFVSSHTSSVSWLMLERLERFGSRGHVPEVPWWPRPCRWPADESSPSSEQSDASEMERFTRLVEPVREMLLVSEKLASDSLSERPGVEDPPARKPPGQGARVYTRRCCPRCCQVCARPCR